MAPTRSCRKLANGLGFALALLTAVGFLLVRLDFTPLVSFDSHGLDLRTLPEVSRFRDDAYYYFCWARNLAEGSGPVVSAGQWTSGVHPLWGLLLTVSAAVFGSAALPVVAHLLGLLLHAITASLLVATGGVRRLFAWTVGLLYLGNPFLLEEAQNGQETALACLLLLVLWRCRRRASPVFVSVSLLAVLGRSDLFGVVAALGIWRGGLRRGLLAPALVLAVHLAVNRVLGGGLLQDSAAPVPWLFWNNFLATDPALADVAARLWWYLRPCLLGGPFSLVGPLWSGVFVYLLLRRSWPIALRALPLLLIGAAYSVGVRDLQAPAWGAFLLGLFPSSGCRSGRWRRPAGDLLALGIGLLAMVGLHYAVRQYPRDYYFAVLGVAGGVALLRAGRLLPWLLPVAALLPIVVVWQSEIGLHRSRFPAQEEMVMAGRFLSLILPEEEAIGCFNSGIVTWHRQGQVVNLDGAVNRRAFQALQKGRLNEYLDRQGVRFLLDNPVQFSIDPRELHASGLWFGGDFDPERDLLEIVRFDVPGIDAGRPGTDSLRLYWRAGRGAPPVLLDRPEDLGPAESGGRYVLWPGKPGVDLWVAPRSDAKLSQILIARGIGRTVFVLKVPPFTSDTVGLFEDASRREPILTYPGL